MNLSKTAAQAALAMAFLAERSGKGPTQARFVAEHLKVPTDSALKMLQVLSRQGLIRSQLGRCGGYWLDRPAQTITLLEIIEAIEGPIGGSLPMALADESLSESFSLLSAVCQDAAETLRQRLAQVSVAQLAGSNSGAAATAELLVA